MSNRKKDKEKNMKRWKFISKLAIGGAIAVSAIKIIDYFVNGSPNEGSIFNNKKCAHCHNTDENTLWDEGLTIYCSKCQHRTSKLSNKTDDVECPYCHRMRDRTALYCRYCNDSSWTASPREEF